MNVTGSRKADNLKLLVEHNYIYLLSLVSIFFFKELRVAPKIIYKF